MSRTCIKYTIVFFNTLLMLIGAAALGVGVWVLTTDQDFIDQTADVLDLKILGSDLLATCSMALITAGAVVFIVGTMGCAGAMSMCSYVLVFYSMSLLILLTLEVAILVLVVVYRSEISNKIDDEVLSRLVSQYGDDSMTFTKSFDTLQKEFECCGWESGKDFQQTNTSRWATTPATGLQQIVPESCCLSSNSSLVADCVADPFPVSNFSIYSNKSCKAELDDKLHQYTWAMIGTTIGLLAFQFLLINLSLCLVVNNNGKKYQM